MELVYARIRKHCNCETPFTMTNEFISTYSKIFLRLPNSKLSQYRLLKSILY